MTEEIPEVRYVGLPDGPKHFVPEFGIEVETFTREPADGKRSLMWHVPLNMRGHFRPDQLANYDREYEYRVDKIGYALCCAKVKSDGETPCRQRAINRYPRCGQHGGRLHPLDKLVTETGEDETEKPMSRYQLFLAKQLTIEDLDDEELLGFAFRDDRGRLFKPKNIPREMVEAFTKGLFDRALEKLKTNALAAANTIAALMTDPSVDASIRLKCATEILDRTVGKAALNVKVGVAMAPWEEVFTGIAFKPTHEIVEGEVTDILEVYAPELPPDVELNPPG